MDWKGKGVLITGASGGIGEAIAREAAAAGAHLILVARRAEKLQEISRELIGQYPDLRIQVIAADVKDSRDREKIQKEARAFPVGLHILINNAGIAAHGRFDESSPEVLREVMEINFFAPAELTRILLPVLRNSRGPRNIIFVSTPSGFHGIPERSAYSSSKAAGNALMESLGLELEAEGIGTTIFAPGYTETDLRNNVLGPDGSIRKEAQHRKARSSREVARMLIRGVEKEKRVIFTDTNGTGIFFLRALAPGLLRRIIQKKTPGQ